MQDVLVTYQQEKEIFNDIRVGYAHKATSAL